MADLFPDLLPKAVVPARSILDVPYDEIMEAWNAMASEHGLPRAITWDDQRRRLAAARWKDPVFVARWKEAIEAIPRNEHWMGANGWKGNFTSFLRPGKYITILERAESPDNQLSAEDQQRTADALQALDRCEGT